MGNSESSVSPLEKKKDKKDKKPTMNPLSSNLLQRIARASKSRTLEKYYTDINTSVVISGNNNITRCVSSHKDKPWIKDGGGVKKVLIAYPSIETEPPSQISRFFIDIKRFGLTQQELDRINSNKYIWYEPSDYFWNIHCQKHHSDNLEYLKCKTSELVEHFIDSKGNKVKFIFGVLLNNGTFRLLTKEDYKKECVYFKNLDIQGDLNAICKYLRHKRLKSVQGDAAISLMKQKMEDLFSQLQPDIVLSRRNIISSVNNSIINYLLNEGKKTIGEYVNKCFELLVFIDNSVESLYKHTKNFRERLADGYYDVNSIPLLNYNDFLERDSIKDKDNFTKILNDLIKHKTDQFVIELAKFLNTTLKHDIISMPIPSFRDEIGDINITEKCKESLDGVDSKDIILYEENGMMYCFNIKDILVTGSVNKYTGNPFTPEFIKTLITKYGTSSELNKRLKYILDEVNAEQERRRVLLGSNKNLNNVGDYTPSGICAPINEELQKEKEKLLEKQKELEEERRKSKESIDKLNDEKDNIQLGIDILNAEKQKKEEELKKLKEELEKEREGAKFDITRLTGENKETEKTLKQKEKEIEQKERELLQLTTELSGDKEQLRKNESNIIMFQENIDQIKKDLQESKVLEKKLRDTIDSLNSDLDERNRKIRELEEEAKKHEDSDEEKKKIIKAEIQKIQDKFSDKMKEKEDELKKERADNISRAQSLEDMSRKLQTEIEKKAKEKEEFGKKYRELVNSVNESEKERNEKEIKMREQLKKLQDELKDEKNKDCESLTTKQLAEYDKKITELAKQIEDLLNRINESKEGVRKISENTKDEYTKIQNTYKKALETLMAQLKEVEVEKGKMIVGLSPLSPYVAPSTYSTPSTPPTPVSPSTPSSSGKEEKEKKKKEIEAAREEARRKRQEDREREESRELEDDRERENKFQELKRKGEEQKKKFEEEREKSRREIDEEEEKIKKLKEEVERAKERALKEAKKKQEKLEKIMEREREREREERDKEKEEREMEIKKRREQEIKRNEVRKKQREKEKEEARKLSEEERERKKKEKEEEKKRNEELAKREEREVEEEEERKKKKKKKDEKEDLTDSTIFENPPSPIDRTGPLPDDISDAEPFTPSPSSSTSSVPPSIPKPKTPSVDEKDDILDAFKSIASTLRGLKRPD